jgi:membrane protease YdiL (CAAX protease family)
MPTDAGVEIALALFMVAAAITSVVALRRRRVLTLDAFERLPDRAAGLQALPFALAALCVFIALPFGASLAAQILPVDQEGSGALRSMAMTTGGAYGLGLVVGGAFLAVLGRRGRRAAAGAHPADLWTGLGSLLLIFPIVYVVNLGSAWLASWLAGMGVGEPPSALAHSTLAHLVASPGGLWWWATIALVVVGAPVMEELLYRGFLQTSFAAAFRSKWLAIFAASALFALAHLGAVPWHALPGLFVVSVAMGILLERTGRLGGAVVAHAGFNALNIALAMRLAEF